MLATELYQGELPKPTRDLFPVGNKVRVLAFGKPHDWSLRLLKKQEEVDTFVDHIVVNALPGIARQYGLGKMLYAPSPIHFNAQVCTEAQTMTHRVQLTSSSAHTTVWLNRGADADAMVLGREHTYVISLAGCPLLLLYHPRKKLLSVAHAGLRSLINEDRLKGSRVARVEESVVFTLINYLHGYGVEAEELHATILFPIDPKHFTYPWDHPTFGAFNRHRSRYIKHRYGEKCVPGYHSPEEVAGSIDLTALIKSQLQIRGIPEDHIDVIPSPPRTEWWDTREREEDRLKRNLVLVQHL